MSGTGPWVVIGLGNPGPQYAGNRHNVGAMVIDILGARLGGTFKNHKARASVLEGRLGVLPGGAPGPRLVLAKPSTYMNESGGPVVALMQFFGSGADRLVVVHDEIDIPYGQLRLKCGGGEGGHNGLRSITRSVGTRDYLRVRVGVGRPPGRMDAADFVLRDFSALERKDVGVLVEEAADAAEMVVERGLLEAQQRYHAPST